MAMNRPSMTRRAGFSLAARTGICFTPAAASSLSFWKRSIAPGEVSARTIRACFSVRLRYRSYALLRPTATRTPSRSTSSTVRSGESAGTRYVPSMTRYGAVNAMSPARAGSMARNATSQAPVFAASETFPALSYVTSSIGMPRRRPSSRARSTETPRGSPVAGSFWASTGLPKLIAARSEPLGAISLVSGRTDPAVAQAQSKGDTTNAAVDFRILRPPALQGGPAPPYTVPLHDRTPRARADVPVAPACLGRQPDLLHRLQGEQRPGARREDGH